MSPRGITRLPIRFASQIHSNLHKLLQSRKIAACPWGFGRAAAAAWPCRQHRTAQHGTTPDPSGQHQDLQEGGTARMMARQGCPCQGTGAAGEIWVVLGASVSLAMVTVLVHWWGSHQSKLSVPWDCRATALPPYNQAHSAATQPNPT